MSRVIPGDDGFDILSEDGRSAHLRWSDLTEIVAFKIDLFSYDTIRLAFRVKNSPEVYEVDEDWPGYNDLVAHIERRFAVRPDWWPTVAFPPFARNRTTLWPALDAAG